MNEIEDDVPNENSSICRNEQSYIDDDTPELHPMSLRSVDQQHDHRHQPSDSGNQKFDEILIALTPNDVSQATPKMTPISQTNIIAQSVEDSCDMMEEIKSDDELMT